MAEFTKLEETTKKNMVFTSAGDNTLFHKLWTGLDANYDIYVIYYGDNEQNFETYKKVVKHIERRKGSKFQNFHYFYKTRPEIIAQYERFFIVDDDIMMFTQDINEMFKYSVKYNLAICQPAFKECGKISHDITKQDNETLIRFTNFIEVNTPLFTKVAMENLMRVYIPELIGWGIDYLYMWANGLEKENFYAVINAVGCINPDDNAKLITGRGRELNLIPNVNNRAPIWHAYADKLGIPKIYTHKTYFTILKDDTYMKNLLKNINPSININNNINNQEKL